MIKNPFYAVRLTINRSKGIALIIVIAITLIVSLLVGLMVSQYIYQRHSIRNSIQKIQNIYTAEAGIKKTFHYLKEDKEKGIEWRTGSFIADKPVKEKVFYQKDNEVELSVTDDCGYLKVRSRTTGNSPKTIEILAAGILPTELQVNLYLISSKPLILSTGSQLKGTIKVNQEPIFRGGSIDGILETNGSLSFPGLLAKSFGNSINYFRYLLSKPKEFEKELLSPQVFSMQNPLPAKKIFVNDAILLENKNRDSLSYQGDNLTLASTAEIQISGVTKISNSTIIAIGPVKILDNAEVNSSKIYSESSIELREESKFSGVLIAPEIKVSEKAQVLNPSVIYCGAPFKNGRISFNNELLASCAVINLCSGKGSLIEILAQAEIEGFVYSHAPILHQGKITGYVYCNEFYGTPIPEDTANTNILSGIIQPMSVTEAYSIPLLFPGIRDFKIIQWQEH